MSVKSNHPLQLTGAGVAAFRGPMVTVAGGERSWSFTGKVTFAPVVQMRVTDSSGTGIYAGSRYQRELSLS